ncbi:MAG TPA: tetratricopeptide repeat protein [Candidatus Polarisedimenticolia bacterium]|jgi:tetratricopeptide (TPR) repeat protein
MTPDRPAADPVKISELKRRLAKEPASRSFFELAREYHEAGQLQEGAAVCAQGLKYHPNYLSARVLLGRILFDMGRTEESRSEMDSVLAVAPDNLVARRILAQICLEQGDIGGALDRLRSLLAFNPADTDTRTKIAEIEAGLHAPAASPQAGPQTGPALRESAAVEAATPVEIAPAAAPAPPPPILAPLAAGPGPQEAPILELVEEPREAPGALESGVLATPTLADIYLQQGLPQKAALVYHEILRGDPDNVEALARLAELERAAPPPPDPAALIRRRKIAALTSWLDTIRRASCARSAAGAPRR